LPTFLKNTGRCLCSTASWWLPSACSSWDSLS